MDSQRKTGVTVHSQEAMDCNREQGQPCVEDLSVPVDECIPAATADAVSKDHPTCPASADTETVEVWDQLV
jgi:hypothetical protein